jgi:hypothetical protein
MTCKGHIVIHNVAAAVKYRILFCFVDFVMALSYVVKNEKCKNDYEAGRIQSLTIIT